MTPEDKAIVERFKAMVSARVSVRQVVLFGSRARGDAEPEADMDVLVVLDEAADEAARDYVSDCAWEVGFQAGIVLVPIVFSRREWEEGPERHSLLAQSVRAEGVPL